jgi:aminoglycoside phosphotransferase family enzyme
VAETHSAVVFFAGSAACHREVELNRCLAPDVYLGVADLVGPGGEV